MNLQETLNGLEVPSGTTKRMDCPNCGGTNSFSVTNKLGVLLFNCYRASCQISGAVNTKVTLEDIQKSLSEVPRFQPFSIPSYFIPIPTKRLQDYKSLHCCIPAVQQGLLSVYKDVKEQRLVFFVTDTAGTVVDACGRALVVGTKPKWKRYGNSKLPLIIGPRNGIGVIVEDALSAAAVAGTGKYTGIALLGTNIHSGSSAWLGQFVSLVVALDYDAANKAIDHVKSLSWFKNAKAMIIKEDFKYWKQEDIIRELDNCLK